MQKEWIRERDIVFNVKLCTEKFVFFSENPVKQTNTSQHNELASFLNLLIKFFLSFRSRLPREGTEHFQLWLITQKYGSEIYICFHAKHNNNVPVGSQSLFWFQFYPVFIKRLILGKILTIHPHTPQLLMANCISDF